MTETTTKPSVDDLIVGTAVRSTDKLFGIEPGTLGVVREIEWFIGRRAHGRVTVEFEGEDGLSSTIHMNANQVADCLDLAEAGAAPCWEARVRLGGRCITHARTLQIARDYVAALREAGFGLGPVAEAL